MESLWCVEISYIIQQTKLDRPLEYMICVHSRSDLHTNWNCMISSSELRCRIFRLVNDSQVSWNYSTYTEGLLPACVTVSSRITATSCAPAARRLSSYENAPAIPAFRWQGLLDGDITMHFEDAFNEHFMSTSLLISCLSSYMQGNMSKIIFYWKQRLSFTQKKFRL